ncbi:Rid family detoxifying hydrolase [Nitrogeniibacter aestuarii]|uniref:Rid family detoxifying hydrolase n=1 Tax=Nitrogeniibacter aestuarii TaxID=2815343 RepID=UPI001D10FE16|nr:Rid family detoxifying hydrolase [Nitrogeniibacter aestuarii]
MKLISTDKAPKAIGPYSQGTVMDGWIFTSGQIPLTAAGEKREGDIATQTGQVFDNLQAVLADQGVSLAQVVKVTVFMTDLGEFAAMNEVFARRFGEHRPARSTVQVVALPTGARVEIEAIARA